MFPVQLNSNKTIIKLKQDKPKRFMDIYFDKQDINF